MVVVRQLREGCVEQVWKRRSNIIEELNELIDELDDIDGHIAAQAPDHIHANEVILSFGSSPAVSLFLKEAAKKRSFQVPHCLRRQFGVPRRQQKSVGCGPATVCSEYEGMRQ